MRITPIGDASRGARPALTDVKHQLRDWIESHFDVLLSKSPTVLQEQLNDELDRSGLFFPKNAIDGQNPLGYLDPIVLETQPGFVIVRTSVGLQVCGTDDSAYIYEWTHDNHLHRIWQSEQNDYEEKKYFPQRLIVVKISPTDWLPGADRSEHLIVTTGVSPWCSSVWQPVYYRVWQTKSTYSEPLLLLAGSEQIDIAYPIHARANKNDILIEYDVIASDAMRVPELRHYVLEHGKLRRTDPVALTPQAFVSFWLRDPWDEVSAWTAPTARVTLKAFRQRYEGTDSEFTPPSRRCTAHPNLWQVATGELGMDLRLKAHYFLIRALPPFRFRMVAESDHPWLDCTEDDPAIDNPPDLFDK